MLPRPDPPRARKRALDRAALASLLLAAGALVAVAPRPALASDPLDVPPSGSIDGDHPYSTVTIKMSGKLKVNAFDSVKKTGGVLHLRSNKIVIDAGASIDASAAGYAGVDKASGDGPGGGKAGGMNLPGGGGAFFGSGGEGTDAMCVPDMVMLGGLPYADPMKIDFANPKTLFGSAGGAAGIMSQGTGGGRGGGAIILEAAEIDLGGTLLANGADGTASVGMIGSGGGAGGLIMLITNKLVLGSSASISAHGGNGGAVAVMPASGGGGGGGLVVINATSKTGMVTPDVSAGHSGMCAGIVAGPGSTTLGKPAKDCLDVDGDTHPAKLCDGGDDCDDSDPNIHPGLPEKCDGIDNDCSGAVDDKLPADACPPGEECQVGKCVLAADAGPGNADAGDAPAKPDHLSLEGGCAIGAAPSAGAVAMAFMAAALLASRRTRRGGKSSRR